MALQEFVAAHKAASEYRCYSPLKVVPRFFTAEECGFFRERLQEAAVLEQLATRKRCSLDSPELADWFWRRLQAGALESFGTARDEWGATWRAAGVNPHFRLVRYDAGDQFAAHEDGFWAESGTRRSFATALVYLNTVDAQHGGATHYLELGVRLQPREGSLLLFFVDGLLHCGEPLHAGVKYILRTDVMYELQATPRQAELYQQLFELKREAEAQETEQAWRQYFELYERGPGLEERERAVAAWLSLDLCPIPCHADSRLDYAENAAYVRLLERHLRTAKLRESRGHGFRPSVRGSYAFTFAHLRCKLRLYLASSHQELENSIEIQCLGQPPRLVDADEEQLRAELAQHLPAEVLPDYVQILTCLVQRSKENFVDYDGILSDDSSSS